MTDEKKIEIEGIIRRNLGEIRLFTFEELQKFIEDYQDEEDEVNLSIYGKKFFKRCNDEHIKTRL